MFEIERKFLVTKPMYEIGHAEFEKRNYLRFQTIEQCYLPGTGDWAIRARATTINGNPLTLDHFLTMKKKQTQMTCVELEDRCSRKMYAMIADQCGHRPLVKKRWLGFPNGFTIDEFTNPEFDWLVMAEIELKSEDEDFPRPDWLGREVTGDPDYSNWFMVQKLRI